MKNERVIKKGEYYELETIEDLMMQQKVSRKEEAQSSSNIPIPNENILTELPSRKDAFYNYHVAATDKIKTDDFGLSEYENSLEQILKQSIRDEERLEIEKLLKEIAEIRNNGELPLNSIPFQKVEEKITVSPKTVELHSEFNTSSLECNVSNLENIKYIELSRLEQIVEILLGDFKSEANTQTPALDSKIKEEIDATYNNLNQLKCLHNLTNIINKISASETKHIEMSRWVEKTEGINLLNKEVLDEFENDELMLKQLESSFNSNVSAVREIIKKLSL